MKTIEAAIIGYRPDWQKWPDTGDTNYDSVLLQRNDTLYDLGDLGDVTLRTRWYPIHRGYAVANHLQLPMQHPFINNLMNPWMPVLDAMIYDLECLANDGVQLVIWEHAYQCYPYVAQHLKRIFKHSVLIHCDDSPGATEIKTDPIAKFFDSAIVGNLIWTTAGEKTKDLYARWGVIDTHYLALSTTGGFMEGLADAHGWVKPREDGVGIAPLRHGFGGAQTGYSGPPCHGRLDLDRRMAQLRAKDYDHDLSFVGGGMGGFRPLLNHPTTTQTFNQAGLRTVVAGIGMRDGPLMPRDPATLGHTVAGLYLRSFAALNVPFIGLMGTRPFDAWASGTLLVQHDPVGELDGIGVRPGVHYADFDGTIAGLVQAVRYYQQHMDEAEAIIRAAYEVCWSLPKTYSIPGAVARILLANWGKWR